LKNILEEKKNEKLRILEKLRSPFEKVRNTGEPVICKKKIQTFAVSTYFLMQKQ
jgi:hypothetical protein